MRICEKISSIRSFIQLGQEIQTRQERLSPDLKAGWRQMGQPYQGLPRFLPCHKFKMFVHISFNFYSAVGLLSLQSKEPANLKCCWASLSGKLEQFNLSTMQCTGKKARSGRRGNINFGRQAFSCCWSSLSLSEGKKRGLKHHSKLEGNKNFCLAERTKFSSAPHSSGRQFSSFVQPKTQWTLTSSLRKSDLFQAEKRENN